MGPAGGGVIPVEDCVCADKQEGAKPSHRRFLSFSDRFRSMASGRQRE